MELVDLQSLKLGNKDGITFCGERRYEIVEAKPYLELNDRTLSLKSSSDADLGEHQV